MKILHRSGKGGFTLIEMLVVIAIIAILTGIIITGLVGSRAKARDAKRASDLSQIALAIEQYFDRCDQYPANITASDLTTINTGCPTSPSQVSLANFISKIPTDPSSVASYGYVTNSTYTDFVLYTTFEASNSVLSQSAPNPSWYPIGGTTNGQNNINCENQATTPSVANGLGYCVRPN
jgi:prepilin-type N-terminal cleavage/methylation domain-containing protein